MNNNSNNHTENNGRVNIMNTNMNQFSLYDKIPINDSDTYYKNALTGTWDTGLLSNAFFSNENIDILQNGIRAGVYNKSNKNFLITLISSPNISVAGITGTPAWTAIFRAEDLSPSALIVSAFGPINDIPFDRQASGKSGFSDRNP